MHTLPRDRAPSVPHRLPTHRAQKPPQRVATAEGVQPPCWGALTGPAALTRAHGAPARGSPLQADGRWAPTGRWLQAPLQACLPATGNPLATPPPPAVWSWPPWETRALKFGSRCHLLKETVGSGPGSAPHRPRHLCFSGKASCRPAPLPGRPGAHVTPPPPSPGKPRLVTSCLPPPRGCPARPEPTRCQLPKAQPEGRSLLVGWGQLWAPQHHAPATSWLR